MSSMRKGTTISLITIFALVAANQEWKTKSPHDNSGSSKARSTKAFLCYWGTWAEYRNEDGLEENYDLRFSHADVDADMCTHLIYSFAGLNDVTNVIESLDPWLDYGPGEPGAGGGLDMLKHAVDLKDGRDLQVLIAIGGWNQESLRFSNMAADSGKRKIFIDSVVEFIKVRNFDGLDMDWEYPAKRGGRPEDKDNFVLLLKELREAFDIVGLELGKKLWLTAALGAGKDTIDVAYDVPNISLYLDFLNIMAYDFKVYVKDEWEQIGHHSPLKPKDSEDDQNRALSVSAAVEYFLELGAPAEKIALGVGAYGKSYTMADPTSHKFYDTVSGPGTKFGFSLEPGTVFYGELCYYLVRPDDGLEGWNFSYDAEYLVPFAYNNETWIGFDDEWSIIEKVDYAHSKNLGGMMIWSLDQDDFRNDCGGWYKNPIGGTVRRRLDYHATELLHSS